MYSRGDDTAAAAAMVLAAMVLASAVYSAVDTAAAVTVSASVLCLVVDTVAVYLKEVDTAAAAAMVLAVKVLASAACSAELYTLAAIQAEVDTAAAGSRTSHPPASPTLSSSVQTHPYPVRDSAADPADSDPVDSGVGKCDFAAAAAILRCVGPLCVPTLR